NAYIIEETVRRSVREINRNVREGEDESLSFYTKKYGGVEMKTFCISEEEIQQASMLVENSFLEALTVAKKIIVSYH
ncbi:histidinol dehydrogenase, partial [Bacillus thuringiensis]|uniref:histidinol dehydrogenase n=1 Tax=Bacillus thuringiensis TaxID=1428 RepID=UPI002850DC13